MYALQQTVAPAVEPLTLAEAKLHLRVDTAFTDDDALITSMIAAARAHAETETRRAFVTQTWKMALDAFPSPSASMANAAWYGPQWGSTPGPLSTLRQDGKSGFEIYLPWPTLQSVTTVQYLEPVAGVLTTLDPSQYIVDAISEPARIVPGYGLSWPATLPVINAVLITFVSGYGAAAAVPEGIKSWMKIRINTLYENREAFAILSKGKLEPLPFVDCLLNPYRVLSF